MASDDLPRWKASTAVEGESYAHTHKRYGAVTVVAVRVPSQPNCTFKLLCRCGCGERAQDLVAAEGYALACLTRERTKAAVAAARRPDGTLPPYKGHSSETVGAYCTVDGVEGQAFKNGEGALWLPFCACGVCFRLTHKCQPIAAGCPTNERCATVVDGVRCKAGRRHGNLCSKCYAKERHVTCPRCPEALYAGRTQCANCDRNDAVAAQRAAHVPKLLALVAAGARDGREVKSWEAEAGIVYAIHNKQQAQRPHLVLRNGKAWAPACVHRGPKGFCGQLAIQTNDGSKTHCIVHDGGMRCESGNHDPDEGVAPWAGCVVSGACKQVPLRGKHVCMPCLRQVDGSNIKVRVYVKKEDLTLAGVAECLVELGRGELCIGRKARMVQDCVTGKSKRRMDADTPMPTDLVACDTEIDENQHKQEEQSCENRKLSGHYIDKGAPQQAGAASSKPTPKFYVLRFNCDGYTDDQGKKHPSLFNRTGVQSEDELLKLEPVHPRFKEGCMMLARAIVELYDNCTRPEFVDALKEWTVVYLRYDGCRGADGTDPGGVAEAVARRVVGAKEKARIEAYKAHAKAKKRAREEEE